MREIELEGGDLDRLPMADDGFGIVHRALCLGLVARSFWGRLFVLDGRRRLYGLGLTAFPLRRRYDDKEHKQPEQGGEEECGDDGDKGFFLHVLYFIIG